MFKKKLMILPGIIVLCFILGWYFFQRSHFSHPQKIDIEIVSHIPKVHFDYVSNENFEHTLRTASVPRLEKVTVSVTKESIPNKFYQFSSKAPENAYDYSFDFRAHEINIDLNLRNVILEGSSFYRTINFLILLAVIQQKGEGFTTSNDVIVVKTENKYFQQIEDFSSILDTRTIKTTYE